MNATFTCLLSVSLVLTGGACKRDGATPADVTAGAAVRSDAAQRKPIDSGSRLTGIVSDLEGLVSELGGRVTDREIIIELPSDVLFDFDRADIRPDSVATLEKLARVIEQGGTGVTDVNGHTDSVGSDAYNDQLSERRAAAVVDWLVRRGRVNQSRLQARGRGESRPVAPNTNRDGSDNPEGRQKNRRVEVVIPRR